MPWFFVYTGDKSCFPQLGCGTITQRQSKVFDWPGEKSMYFMNLLLAVLMLWLIPGVWNANAGSGE